MATQDVQEQASGRNFMKKSTYASFIPAVEKLQKMAEAFQVLLLDARYSDNNDRTEIVRYSYLLKGEELWELLDIEERANLNKYCIDLESINNTIAKYISWNVGNVLSANINSAIGIFEHKAHDFIQYYNQLLTRHNMGIIAMKQKQEIERYRSSINAHPNRFLITNSIPISMEMELWCRGLYIRAMNGWYNIIGVEGEAGVGKTMFTWAAMQCLSDMFRMKFDPVAQMLLNESREYTEKQITKLPKYGILDLDEAGNQLNAKTTYDEGQLAITNRINLIRFMRLTIFTTWPYIKGLDSTLRNKQMQQLISIQERGNAIVRTLNKNPYTNEAVGSPKKYRDTQVDTHADASDMLEADIQTIFTIPYYEIPAKLWTPYEERKVLAKNMGKRLTTKSDSNEFYTQFLCQLDPSVAIINDKMLDDFSVVVSYKLYMQPLVKRLAKSTGQQISDIWVSKSMADPYNIGELTVNRLVASYIHRLQAEKKGAEEAQKNEVEPNA